MARAAARARVVLVWLVAGVLLAVTSGCIFSPRDPDGPPDEGSDIPWVTPTDTDKVLQNLAAALAGEGISNYMDCLIVDSVADSFKFHVDPQDSLDAGQEGEDRYARWRRDDEATYIDGVFLDSDVGIDVVFTTVEEPDENEDETYRREDYELTIVWRFGDHQPGLPVTYRGQVTFWLRRDETQLWSIFKWVDRRAADPGESATWGVLRGDYRQ
ncbi:MAG: hypothetical protein U9Q95_02080 [Candidatus Eisenbacteria bacterium]|nr:hypothetical protein [Candidatus Eisenbacteria bacterium]